MKKRRTRKMNVIRKTRRKSRRRTNKIKKKKLYSKSKKINKKMQLGGSVCAPRRDEPEPSCHVCGKPIEGRVRTGAHTCRKCGHTFCGSSCGKKNYPCMMPTFWNENTYWPDWYPHQWWCNICNGEKEKSQASERSEMRRMKARHGAMMESLQQQEMERIQKEQDRVKLLSSDERGGSSRFV